MSIYTPYSSYTNRDYFSRYKKENDFNTSSLSNVYRDLLGSDKKSSFSSDYIPQRSLSGVDMRSNYRYVINNEEDKNGNYEQPKYKVSTPLQNQNQFNYNTLTNVANNFINNNSQEKTDQFLSYRNSLRNRSEDFQYNNVLSNFNDSSNINNNINNNFNNNTNNNFNNNINNNFNNNENNSNRNFYDTISTFGPITQSKSSSNYNNINNDNQKNIGIYSTDTLNPDNKSNLILKNYFNENKSPNIYNNNNNFVNDNINNNFNLRYSYPTPTINNPLSQSFNIYNNNNSPQSSLPPYKQSINNNNFYNKNENYNTIKSAEIGRMSNKIYPNNFSLFDNPPTNPYENSQRNSLYNSLTPNTNQKICSYGAYTMAGTTCFRTTKTNQDSYLLKFDKNSNNESEYTLGIFDGHGNHGHFLSQAIKQFFTSLPPYNNPSESTFLSIFKNLSNYINNSQNFESIISGSTVVLVHINFPKIFCINCGDSRAILITKNNNIIELSRDQKPEIPEEKIRILKMGGRIDKIKGTNGPMRVWYKNEDYPGLAMSRSIGDQLAHKVGVSDEPEVKEFDANELNALAVVVASDGVWEFMSNEDVRNVVMNYEYGKDASACAKGIVDKARDVWKKTGFNIDDITAVVAFFG